MLKHAAALKLRQLIPVVIAPIAALALLTPLAPIAAAPVSIWLGISLAYGFMLGLREKNPCACASGVAAAIMHFSWSLGFLGHLARLASARPPQALAALPERFPQDRHIGRERP
jgi:succinoglycan biosynthesis protein ExoA